MHNVCSVRTRKERAPFSPVVLTDIHVLLPFHLVCGLIQYYSITHPFLSLSPPLSCCFSIYRWLIGVVVLFGYEHVLFILLRLLHLLLQSNDRLNCRFDHRRRLSFSPFTPSLVLSPSVSFLLSPHWSTTRTRQRWHRRRTTARCPHKKRKQQMTAKRPVQCRQVLNQAKHKIQL